MADTFNPARSQLRTKRSTLRQRGRWTLLFVTLLAAIGGVYGTRPESLLERSKHIVSLQGIGSGKLDRLTPVWMNERELLLLRYPSAGGVQIECLDVTTGARSPAPDVERVLHPTNAIPNFSPDGKRLLLTAQSAEKETMDRLLWIARPLQGDSKASWFPAEPKAFSNGDYYVAWLPDSLHVAEFLPVQQSGAKPPVVTLPMHIHAVQTGEDAALALPIPAQVASHRSQTFDTYLLPGKVPLLLRMDPSTNDGAYGWGTVAFFAWENMLQRTPSRTWKVDSPPGYSGAAVKVSPADNRIAWVFVKVGVSSAVPGEPDLSWRKGCTGLSRQGCPQQSGWFPDALDRGTHLIRRRCEKR